MQCQCYLPANPRYVTVQHAIIFIIGVLLGLFGSRQLTQAQPFTSGSSGADGALNLTTPGTIIFDPRAFNPPLDLAGDNVYHFTTITIGAGVTVRLLANHLPGPVFWFASGAVQIDGTIDLNGGDGQMSQDIPTSGSRAPSIPGAGGYPGGVAGFGNTPPQPGAGPGGGGAGVAGCNITSGAGAGHAIAGTGSFCSISPGQAYGNDFLVPLLGGSGGGGSRGRVTGTGAAVAGDGGGAGEGAFVIASSASMTVNGVITANGGFGRDGGGGSGGAIHL